MAGLPEDLKGYRWVSWKAGQGLIGLESSRLFARKMREKGPAFEPAGRLMEVSGPVRGGLQEKPEWVDWDEDGDPDLLAGEFAGTIHLYENSGAPGRPKFLPPVPVAAAGRPVRITRDGVFGGKHWHGMAGYPSVACADWDGGRALRPHRPERDQPCFLVQEYRPARLAGLRGEAADSPRRVCGFRGAAGENAPAGRGTGRSQSPLSPGARHPVFLEDAARHSGLHGGRADGPHRARRPEKSRPLCPVQELARGIAPRPRRGSRRQPREAHPGPHFFKLRDVDWTGTGSSTSWPRRTCSDRTSAACFF